VFVNLENNKRLAYAVDYLTVRSSLGGGFPIAALRPAPYQNVYTEYLGDAVVGNGNVGPSWAFVRGTTGADVHGFLLFAGSGLVFSICYALR
jgi:hypothetical protein